MIIIVMIRIFFIIAYFGSGKINIISPENDKDI